MSEHYEVDYYKPATPDYKRGYNDAVYDVAHYVYKPELMTGEYLAGYRDGKNDALDNCALPYSNIYL